MNTYFSEEIKKTTKDIKSQKNDLCFALLSNSQLSDTGSDTRKNIKAVDSETGFDFLVHLGNIINGNNPKNISEYLLSCEIEKYKKAVKSEKLFVTQGFSDGYRDERFIGQLAKNIVYDKMWYNQTAFINGYANVKRPSDKPYYFVDFPEKNIRLIFLCSYFSQIDEANGLYEKYTGIDIKQAAWLKNTALDLPLGTTVLLFSHAIPKSRFETGEDPFIYKGYSTEPILMLLEQAKKRGINIACWFGGAYNCDCEINVGGINYAVINSQLARPFSCSKCSGVRFLKDRGINTVNQDCWDAVCINTAEKVINIYRFGAGEDRKIYY